MINPLPDTPDNYNDLMDWLMWELPGVDRENILRAIVNQIRSRRILLDQRVALSIAFNEIQEQTGSIKATLLIAGATKGRIDVVERLMKDTR